MILSFKARKILLGKQRRASGATMVALILVLALCVILPLGLLGFEASRFFLMQEELKNISDSAALAGTAAMASAPSPPAINYDTNLPWSYGDRQFVAMVVAAKTFAQNSILQTSFTLGPIASSADGTSGYTPPSGTTPNVTALINPTPPTGATPPVYNAVINVILLDSSNNQVALGGSAAKIQVQAYYSDQPIFLGISSGWNSFVTMGSKYQLAPSQVVACHPSISC